MFHQIVAFNGIETCSATSFINSDFKYILSTEAEAISITNLPDVNSRLSKLRQDNIISEYIESSKRAFSNRFSSTIDCFKYTKYAAFVSLEARMILLEEMTNIKI